MSDTFHLQATPNPTHVAMAMLIRRERQACQRRALRADGTLCASISGPKHRADKHLRKFSWED